MSGIAGLYRRDGRVLPPEQLPAMLGAIRHRGPHGEGRWAEGPCGLAQCALHTTPEARYEEQPLVRREGSLVLVADARIDNREELLRRLEHSPAAGAVTTDAELILAAYRRWGRSCPEHLVGAYAFLVWDARRRELIAARDHAGIRPLYVFLSERLFAAASEIKALLTLPDVPRRTNEARIAAHLTTVVPEEPSMTWFKGIYRLPSAHVLTVRPDGVSLRRYWQLSPHREIRYPTDEDYAAAFRERFEEAVRCRLRRTTPVGSTLSGGMDSSSIACVARDLLQEDAGEPLHTFTVIFPEAAEAWRSAIDERSYVEAVHAQGGFEAHFFRADGYSPLWNYDKVAWHLDEGIWAPNLYLHLGMYEQARRHGVRVLLDGIDGDSVVSHGLEYLAELFSEKQWAELEWQIRALSEVHGVPPARYVREHLYPHLTAQLEAGKARDFVRSARQLNRHFDIPWRELFSVNVLPTLLSEKGLALWNRARGRTPSTPASLINPGFARRSGLASDSLGFSDVLSEHQTDAREAHIYGLSDALFGPLFELADKSALAYKVEARFPFFDRRLVEFCVALAPTQKIKMGWTRYVLRRAMAGILPSEVQWRKGKAHLGGNFVRNLWAYEQDALREMVYRRPSPLDPYVDRSALERLYEQARRTNGEAGRAASTRDLYTVLTLQRWLERTPG